jgi:hypothetical protein
MYQVILKRRNLAPLAGKLELYLLRITFVEINLKPMVVSYICKSIVHYVFLGSLCKFVIIKKERSMANSLRKSIAVLGVSLMFSMGPWLQGISLAQTAPAKDSKAAKSSSAKTTTTAPSDSEIADAKAKGMVWVNTSSKIYHKEGKSYGKTKRGQFMSEDDAKKAGYREAKTETSTKAKPKTADTKQK